MVRYLLFRQRGSSPHARGTPSSAPDRWPLLRFIPACAGNTAGSGACSSCSTVHPRMRGEHCEVPAGRSPEDGSSPHARGTLRGSGRGDRRVRFIPACAGNTTTAPASGCWGAVHPRMRGEHNWGLFCVYPQAGSSPHARGTQQLRRHRPRQRRFIPACAGNTCEGDARHSAQTVHPRMRGEHQTAHVYAAGYTGSSPHARGTLVCLVARAVNKRFIPACAGNTRP